MRAEPIENIGKLECCFCGTFHKILVTIKDRAMCFECETPYKAGLEDATQ